MSIRQVAEGISYGLGLSEIKRLEDSVHAGRNAYLTALLQTLQIRSGMAIADKALEAVGSQAIPLPARCVFYLTPLLLSIVTKQQMIEDERLLAVVIFVQDQISNLCHIASLVSSVALIYFGSPLFSGVCLASLAIGLLDRHGILPVGIRQALHEYSPPLLVVTGIFTDDLLIQFFSTLNLASYCVGRYFEWQDAQRVIPLPEENVIDLQDFLLDEPPLRVNRDYLLWPTHARAIPDVDIQLLVDQFQAINWNPQNIAILRRKLGEDQRFAERCGDPAEKNDEQLVLAAQQQLENCVTAVKERRILAGEPRSYDKLTEYMKFIAHELPRRPVSEQIDSLMILAIEGGEYCGPGIYDAAEMIYGALIGESEFFTFPCKVLNCLQSARNRVMEGVYAQVFGLQENREEQAESSGVLSGLGAVFDWNDRHNVHQFQNLYGSELGLRKAGADNDEIAFVDPLTKLTISYFLGDAIKGVFWQRHSLNEIVETVRNAIGTPELPKHEMYDWWNEWIERQAISEHDKIAQKNKLEWGRLYNQDLEEDGKMKPEFIRAMLLNMGVLQPL